MIRSARKYDLEVRERTLYGETTYGVVSEFVYTDKGGQDWIRMDEDWHRVNARYTDPHIITHKAPKGPLKADDEQLCASEPSSGWEVAFDEAEIEGPWQSMLC